MIPSRAPGHVWCLRPDLREHVRTTVDDGIVIWTGDGRLVLDRATARLLAKRINECLDATVKR